MSLYSDTAWGRDTELSQEELNRRAKIVADAIETLRAFVPSWQAEVNALREIGLERINTALIPAYQQVIELSNLGALLSSSSASTVAIGPGTKTFLIPESKRMSFAPTPLLIAYADGSYDLSMTGTVSSYTAETGILIITVESFRGEGEFSNWMIGPIATTDDLEALRDQIETRAAQVAQDRQDAQTAAGVAAPAAIAATGALAAFNKIWYGARDTAPEGASLGSQFLDTAQTPNVVKVLQETGWAPTVTVSIGGSRQQAYTATAGQTGPFIVDGGFTLGSVNLNGLEFFDGAGVTLDPEEGSFTFGSPLSAGDLIVFRGYLANDAVDVYTKSEANALLVEKLDKAGAIWATKAIGEPFPLWDHLVGCPIPPKGDFIKLTAGLTGAGAYNEGVLTSESVSGSAPLVVATAVISDEGSPINGQTVYLINTERRFIRAGNSGTAQYDALQNLVGSFGRGSATGVFSDTTMNVSGVFDRDTTTNKANQMSAGTQANSRDVSFDASRVARTSNETRPKEIGATYYMRIK